MSTDYSDLTDEQRQRAAAVRTAREALIGRGGFAAVDGPDSMDIVNVASWIVDGENPYMTYEEREQRIAAVEKMTDGLREMRGYARDLVAETSPERRYRKHVLNVVSHEGAPISGAEVARRCAPEPSRATVYRTLNDLYDEMAIANVGSSERPKWVMMKFDGSIEHGPRPCVTPDDEPVERATGGTPPNLGADVPNEHRLHISGYGEGTSRYDSTLRKVIP